jgi:phage portal protein BeeE
VPGRLLRRRALRTLPPSPSVQAAGTVALATVNRPTFWGWGTGGHRLAPFDFAPPVDVWSREAAVSVPAISRARDLICSAVSALPLTLWTVRWDQPTRSNIEESVPPAGWMARPDPNRTRQWMLSWTTDDLLFTGRAYWRITSRYANTFPAQFQWMPAADVLVDATGRITHRGVDVPAADVVEFLSPFDGLLFVGWRTIQTALNLDAAAERFSTSEIPAGWLEQTENSEPMSADDLTEIAETFAAARAQRAVAALNPYVRWRESSMDPSRLQLVEARQHQALELARIANIPPYFIGAPAGTGMTYLNAAQAKQDLIDYGAAPYIATIEQTLSGPNVSPHGQAVRLDLNAWLRNPYTPDDNAAPTDLEIAYNLPDQPEPAGTPGRPRDIDGRNEG